MPDDLYEVEHLVPLAYGYCYTGAYNNDQQYIFGFQVPEPGTAEIVQRIFQMYADGMSPAKIATILESEGIPSFVTANGVATPSAATALVAPASSTTRFISVARGSLAGTSCLRTHCASSRMSSGAASSCAIALRLGALQDPHLGLSAALKGTDADWRATSASLHNHSIEDGIQHMTKNVLFYARYSTDRQNEVSIETQTELGKKFVADRDWKLVATYSDSAISGTAFTFRPGIQQLLAHVKRERIDVVLCVNVDRLSRDVEHTSKILKDLNYHDCAIWTVEAGRAVTDMELHMRSTMSHELVEQGRTRTREGMKSGTQGEGNHLPLLRLQALPAARCEW